MDIWNQGSAGAHCLSVYL